MKILVASWSDGVFMADGSAVERELSGKSVTSLSSDTAGAVLAIVGGSSLFRRSLSGEWATLATSTHPLSACAALGESIFVGTSDAKVLRLEHGELQQLPSFNTVAGRETWYAGSTIIDGRVVGPPLGVRSMCGACDGSTLLVNVHVGGIPRSTDSGQTWKPTIEVAADVHQVVAHPEKPQLVAAATALGLALSDDGGQSWKIESEGLHAKHCLAVAFVGEEVWVSASVDPFSDGAVYRWTGSGPLRRLTGSVLPQWFERGVDTGNLAARGDVVAIADRAGHLYVSRDRGTTWALDTIVPGPTGVLVLPSGQ